MRRKTLRASSAGVLANCPSALRRRSTRLATILKRMGAPTGWTLHVTDIALSAGAGFLVVISGSMMLMPGLPKVSRAWASTWMRTAKSSGCNESSAFASGTQSVA